MFFSQCPGCGKTNRWLTVEECKDEEFAAKMKKTPVTQEEFAAYKGEVEECHCLACKPNDAAKKPKTAKKSSAKKPAAKKAKETANG